MKKRILIAGGSGLVGSRLVELLDPNRYHIHILTRRPKETSDFISYFKWDFKEMSIDHEAVNVDHIINLTGAGIADKRWTDSRKKILIDSRVKSAELIKTALQSSGHRPQSYISASAVGFYGDRKDEKLVESSPAGSGFMADCCKLWEDAANGLRPYVGKIFIDRIGIVLSTKGGALTKILMTKQVGVYNYFGSGKQYYSWIHIDDLCHVIIDQMEKKYTFEVYNLVSTNPITNKQFTIAIKNALNGFVAMPAPIFGLRLLLGEMANVVLNSNRAYPENLEKESFNFKFTNLGEAVKDLLRRKI